MKGVLKTLEPRILITVGVSLLLLIGAWVGAWSPVNRRLAEAERSLATAEARLEESRGLVLDASTIGLSTADDIAEAIRRMEALIPDDLDDLEVARLVSSAAIANDLTLEQWDALEPLPVDGNVSANPYQFRISGELSGINAMLDGLPGSVGRPLTYRDIRIDAPPGSGLVFGVRLVMTGVVDIWVYTGGRAVAVDSEADGAEEPVAGGIDGGAPGAEEPGADGADGIDGGEPGAEEPVAGGIDGGEPGAEEPGADGIDGGEPGAGEDGADGIDGGEPAP